MNKFSQAEAGQAMKLAANSLRALSEENQDLKTKLSHYEKKEHAEKVARLMEEKGIEPELSFQDKVAGLLRRERLDVVEEAVGLAAPQMKLASVHDDARVNVEGSSDGDSGFAAQQFAANLASS